MDVLDSGTVDKTIKEWKNDADRSRDSERIADLRAPGTDLTWMTNLNSETGRILGACEWVTASRMRQGATQVLAPRFCGARGEKVFDELALLAFCYQGGTAKVERTKGHNRVRDVLAHAFREADPGTEKVVGLVSLRARPTTSRRPNARAGRTQPET